MSTSSKRFVILDRDGTVIVERHYLSDPAQVELLPNAVEGLRHMRELGFGLVLVTNQSGIGRGYFSEAQLTQIHDRLRAALKAEGLTLDGIYYCPCWCYRKSLLLSGPAGIICLPGGIDHDIDLRLHC